MVFKRPQTIFTVVCLQVYYRAGQNIFFEEISDQPLGFHKLAGSTFNIENNDPITISATQCSYQVFIYGIV